MQSAIPSCFELINDSFLKNEVNEEGLIKSMIGKNISIKNNNQNIINFQKPILKINNYSYSNTFKKISMDLFEGEILGLSGLLGSGANELLRCIFGKAEYKSSKSNLKELYYNLGKEIKFFSQKISIYTAPFDTY